MLQAIIARVVDWWGQVSWCHSFFMFVMVMSSRWHIHHSISKIYLLNQLRQTMSLDIVGLSTISRCLVVSEILYARPAISGSLNQYYITHLDALLRKAKRWGLTEMAKTFGDLSDNADDKLFRSLPPNSEPCLAQLLPALNRKDRRTLRHETKNDIPLIKNNKLSNSFIIRFWSHK